MQKIKARF